MSSATPRQAEPSLAAAPGIILGALDPSSASRLPLVVTPAEPIADVCEWAQAHRGAIQAALDDYGGILFRGFGLTSPGGLDRFITATSGTALPYTERTTPRTKVEGNIYTSTDYPISQEIFLHNENSYRDEFPLKVYFGCLQPADAGGETPIADCRRVYARLRDETRARFADGYLYVRNFGGGPGMAWQEAFQTQERGEVEAYCREHHIDCEWRSGNRLRTRQRRRTIATHPRTGEMVWFNHMTFFHLTTLPAAFQQLLATEFPDDLPNQTYHADGSEIVRELIDELRAAYRAEMVVFPWHAGDVLLLDNMLAAHARMPFKGQRRVIVGMAEACAWDRV